jgi:hypothetical protein
MNHLKKTVIPAKTDPDRDILFTRLAGKVFHLTTEKAFPAIVHDGKIGHNREAKYPLNSGSKKSFGRVHGYVCLYDLREASPRRLSLTRELCDFLHPDWLAEEGGKHPVYLVLRPEALDRLVPNPSAFHFCRATGKHLKYLPKTECWHPGDLPLRDVAEVLRLKR